MRIFSRVAFLAACVVCSAAVTAPVLAQKAAPKPALKRNYVRKDHGFAINQPVGWTSTRKDMLPDMIVCYFKEKQGGYQPLIAITVKEAPGAVMPPNMVEVLDKGYKSQFPEFTLISSSRFKMAGKDAVAIAFTTRSPQTQILVDLRRVYVVHKGKLIMFEIAAEVADYELLVPAFDKMMSTLVFLP